MLPFHNKKVIIIGAGATINDYKNEILNYISSNDMITIGINKMTSFIVPDYHLWTNTQRFISQHDCINKKSNLLFGINILDKLINKYWKGDFIKVNYVNESSLPISYKDGVICGNFRTAGILAIMIAHVSGASFIDIVGMDGFTMYTREELENKKASHHCYGKGYTDDASWEKCLKKDNLVNDGLFALKNYGVQFRIITPTKFKDFYNGSVLKE